MAKLVGKMMIHPIFTSGFFVALFSDSLVGWPTATDAEWVQYVCPDYNFTGDSSNYKHEFEFVKDPRNGLAAFWFNHWD